MACLFACFRVFNPKESSCTRHLFACLLACLYCCYLHSAPARSTHERESVFFNPRDKLAIYCVRRFLACLFECFPGLCLSFCLGVPCGGFIEPQGTFRSLSRLRGSLVRCGCLHLQGKGSCLRARFSSACFPFLFFLSLFKEKSAAPRFVPASLVPLKWPRKRRNKWDKSRTVAQNIGQISERDAKNWANRSGVFVCATFS